MLCDWDCLNDFFCCQVSRWLVLASYKFQLRTFFDKQRNFSEKKIMKNDDKKCVRASEWRHNQHCWRLASYSFITNLAYLSRWWRHKPTSDEETRSMWEGWTQDLQKPKKKFNFFETYRNSAKQNQRFHMVHPIAIASLAF